MIIEDLQREYHTLAAQNLVPQYGWDKVNAPYGLVINDDGIAVDTEVLGNDNGKKPVNSIPVPVRATRTSGIVPNFLCDNAKYLLGYDDDDSGRAMDAFQACAEYHLKLLHDIDCPEAAAVRAFFSRPPQWEAVKDSLGDAVWKMSLTSNYVLMYDAPDCTKLLTNCAPIREAWNAYYDSIDTGDADADDTVVSIVSGELIRPAKTHPKVKGVVGAQSAGASLISFNTDAFCSYGMDQCENAPMSTREAYEYTTAINTMLADREHVNRIGDATVVAWANCGVTAYTDIYEHLIKANSLFANTSQSQNKQMSLNETTLHAALNAFAHGRPYEYEGIRLDPGEEFHILALSPNAARLSVRFYLTNSFGTFARNISQHYQDLEIRRPSFDKTKYLPTWRLLQQTVNQNSKNKDVAPNLAGDIMRAILTGSPYPATLINAVQRRIRAEHDVSPDKASIIKAYYLRLCRQRELSGRLNNNLNAFKEVLRMDINEDSGYTPYVLGRLFSIYEQIQIAAVPNINTTIKDKYFNSASATPARVFPILGNLAQKHMRKSSVSAANRVRLSKTLGELSSRVGIQYPTRLSLAEQGAFQLGYYYENQKRFSKQTTETNNEGADND